MVGKYGQVVIENKKTLMEEIKTMLPFTSIHLIGPSGSGKTSLVEELIKEDSLKIDEIKILRLQGVSSEDFRLPVIKETVRKDGSREKVVELINMGIFQEILDNPEKQYLVFLDEMLRANSEVAPLLFSILERRINGIPVDNMYVVASSNFGGQYIQNFDFSDSALRRRQIFIEYVPSKQDILDFCQDHDYNELLLEVMQNLSINDLISHDQTTKELEQDTQLGSWHLLNCRWNLKKIKDYSKAILDISSFGGYCLSDNSKQAVLNQLSILKQLQEIDIDKEIIKKHGLDPDVVIYNKKGKVFDKEGKESELRIRTKEFILKQTLAGKENYFANNFEDIFETFSSDMVMLIALLKDLKDRVEKLSKKDKKLGKTLEVFKNEVFTKVVEATTNEKYKEVADEFLSLITLNA